MGNRHSRAARSGAASSARHQTLITVTDSRHLGNVLFVFCSPVPEISWRRTSGVPFPSKVKMKNSNAVLEIPNFQQEDAGTYECVAENWRGKNAARGRLSFHGQWSVSGAGRACVCCKYLPSAGVMHATSSFNCICLTGIVFACNMWGLVLPWFCWLWIRA